MSYDRMDLESMAFKCRDQFPAGTGNLFSLKNFFVRTKPIRDHSSFHINNQCANEAVVDNLEYCSVTQNKVWKQRSGRI